MGGRDTAGATGTGYPIVTMPSPGRKGRGRLRFAHPALADWQWPYVAVSGAHAGPRILIVAGIHGAEYPPIEAAIRFGRWLEADQLAGSVLIIPVVNLPAFWERSMFVCPLDGKNLNRVFPGRPDGTFSEVLAHHLTTDLFDHADVILDLHCGDLVEALVPFTLCQQVGDEALDAASEALARVFGLPYVIVNPPSAEHLRGTTYATAAGRGKRAIIAEAGGLGQLTEPAVGLLVRGLHNVLRSLRALPGEPEGPLDQVTIARFDWLYSKQAGLFTPEIAAGDAIQAGQQVGVIRDLCGEPVERVTAPAGGVVLFLTANPAVKAEGLLMGIGVPA